MALEVMTWANFGEEEGFPFNKKCYYFGGLLCSHSQNKPAAISPLLLSKTITLAMGCPCAGKIIDI